MIRMLMMNNKPLINTIQFHNSNLTAHKVRRVIVFSIVLKVKYYKNLNNLVINNNLETQSHLRP